MAEGERWKEPRWWMARRHEYGMSGTQVRCSGGVAGNALKALRVEAQHAARRRHTCARCRRRVGATGG